MTRGIWATCCFKQAHEPSGPTPSPFSSWYVDSGHHSTQLHFFLSSDIPARPALRGALNATRIPRRPQQVHTRPPLPRPPSTPLEHPHGTHAPPRPPRPALRALGALRAQHAHRRLGQRRISRRVFHRRFGAAFARTLGSALIHGIYAADSRKLSVRAAFPMLRASERRGNGSVVWGELGPAAWFGRPAGEGEDGRWGWQTGERADPVWDARIAAAAVLSFRGGMETLGSALVKTLGTRIPQCHATERYSRTHDHRA